MYIPKYFKITDVNEIWDFIQMNSFGTVVTTDQGKPYKLSQNRNEIDYANIIDKLQNEGNPNSIFR